MNDQDSRRLARGPYERCARVSAHCRLVHSHPEECDIAVFRSNAEPPATPEVPLTLSEFMPLLIDAASRMPGYEHAVRSAILWFEDWGECSVTERESAIRAFKKIMSITGHDHGNPIFEIASEEHAALVQEANHGGGGNE